MADSIAFTLSLIDRMSGPAKAAASAVSALNEQVLALKSSLDSIGKFSFKVPRLGDEAARKATENIGPAFGPGRKEAEAAAKYRDRLEQQSVRAAEQLDKQRQRALYAEYQKTERQKATHHAIDAIEAHVAPIAGSEHASKLADTLKEVAELAGGHGLLNMASTLGAPLRGVYGLKQALGELGEGFEAVTGVSPALAAGIAGVAAAAVIAAAGVVKAAEAIGDWVVEGAHMALEAVEAKEKTLDLLSAMLGSEDAAKEVTGAISGIVNVTGIAGSRVSQLARELSAAGLAGDLLTSSMKAIAQAETVLPEGGAKLQKITERAVQTGKFALSPKQLVGTGLQVQKLYEEIAQRTGVGVKQVEAQLKAGKVSAETGIAAMNAVISEKFGAVAAKQAKDLDVQLQRYHANIAKLFKDVNVEGFLDKLQGILGIIDQANESGKALHDILTVAFDAVFKVIEKVEPYVEIFFLGLELAALKVYNALRPVADQLGFTFGDDNQDSLDTFENLMIDFADAVGAAADGVAALAQYQFVWDGLSTAFDVIGYAADAAFGPILAIPEAIFDFGAAFLLAIAWLSKFGPEAERSGQAMVDGLITGIEAAGGQLYDTVSSLATKALDKFKSVFGIHSPSRVMAQMGGHMTEGLAIGISSGARQQSGAMVGAGAQLSLGAAAGAQLGMLSHIPRALAMNDNALGSRSIDPVRTREQSSPDGGRGGVVFMPGAFAPGAIQLSGQGAAEIKNQAEEIFIDVFEKAALATGTA